MKLNPLVMMREEFDGTGIVFDPDHNKTLTLNATGVSIWKTLASGGTEEDAVARLLDAFSGVTREQAEKDVRMFVSLLQEKDLLSRG